MNYCRRMPGEPLEELMASLQRLGRLFASRQITSRITTAAGVEVSQQGATLLRALLRGGQQSMAGLAHTAAMDLGAVSRQVRLLEEAKLVQRLRSPNDGRVALLELTAKGTRIAERIKAVGVQHLEQALDNWSEADQRTLATLMGRLVDDMISTPVPTTRTRSSRNYP
jgi:DNA-binding MarR family transcriptional regulator